MALLSTHAVVACMLAAARLVTAQNSSFDVFDFIDPLVGTSDGGHVFAGSTLPFGMAKAVADTTGDPTGGFSFDGSPIQGFSQMHDSGTGGSASLGNFPLFAQAGCPGDELDNCQWPKLVRPTGYARSSVVSQPGYFSVTLNTSVQAEMTSAMHTNLFRFTFPAVPRDGSPPSPLIHIDLADLSNTRSNGSVTVDDVTGRIVGNATFQPSFGSGTYDLHFCADFQGAAVRETGIWVNNRAGTSPKHLTINRGINGFPLPGGAFTRFHAPDANGQILARVAVSFISVAQACASAEKEIPDFDFAAVRSTAEDAWRAKLTPISITPGGVSSDIQKIFWSGVYRTMQSPQDYTGENPLWESDEPYYDSMYCIWDSFRSQYPFLTVVDPSTQSRIVRSLLNIYEHLGYLPDCRMSLCKGFTQGGSNADVVIADAYVKKLTDGIDFDLAYEAVVKDAEVEPIDWSNEGRGGLTSWKTLGYIPAEDFDFVGFGTMTRSVSRTVEYAYNDFCVAELAKGLGKFDDYEKYAARSGNWANLWVANQTSKLPNGTNTGFVGYFQPRFLNKTFGFQDPVLCSNLIDDGRCSLTNNAHETFESSIWEYNFFVPGDMAAVITLMGGPDTFTRRLDYFHDSKLAYVGNEPVFLTLFQYHYAGRPGLSARRSHLYLPSSFENTPEGLPGNDDSGALGSFVAFNMMGLFPNPGQNVYFIIPPYFQSVSITSPITNKTATITNLNFDPTYKAIYIQSATLDGKPYTKNWIGHEFFLNGGTLELTLGLNESSWGTAVEDLPPSLSSSANSTAAGSHAGNSTLHRRNMRLF